MTDADCAEGADTAALDPRTLMRELRIFAEAHPGRSFWELAITLVPFVCIIALMLFAVQAGHYLALALVPLAGLFLLRIFIIQHDCGHQAFFKNRQANDWLGRVLGVLTLTPYDVWRRTHSIHHAHAGNLDRRGIGDVMTLTVAEYNNRSLFGRLKYRLYRHPLVMFVLGPTYLFILEYRLPLGLMKAGWRYWLSAMGTNIALAGLLTAIYLAGGLAPIFLIFLPTTITAATIGVWLFYVQHQFEETHWSKGEDWQLHNAALEGSSHYILPQPLRWLSGNIGIHHVHHLYSRIPFYRLPEVIRVHAELAEAQRLTIRDSLRTVGLHLWDEAQGKLTSIREAKARYGFA
jgi:omega-6 fatty acid desaturase (delta-12 desaturase)